MWTSRGGAKARAGSSAERPRGAPDRGPQANVDAPQFDGGRLEISSWLGKQLVLLIGLVVATVMFVISGVMNFRFGMTLGTGVIDPWLYGFASLTADGFKALLPFIAIGLWRARKPLLTISALAIWCLCVAWSMASAMGFATTTRDVTVATRDATNKEREALSQRAARLESQVALLPAHRPAGAVRAAIANADVPRNIWRRTSQCADVTIPESLAACQQVLDLRKELAIAEDAARLEQQLIDTRAALGGIEVIGEKKDPQAETISSVLGLEPGQIRSGLAVLITLLIEAGSALGFTLVALGAGQLRVERLPPRLKLSKEARAALTRELMDQQLEGVRQRNFRNAVALTAERVDYEEQLTKALVQIDEIQKRRPAPIAFDAAENAPSVPPSAPAPPQSAPAAEPASHPGAKTVDRASPIALALAPAEAEREIVDDSEIIDDSEIVDDSLNQDPENRRPEDESQAPSAVVVAAEKALVRAREAAAEAERSRDLLAERSARQAAERSAEQASAARQEADRRASEAETRAAAAEAELERRQEQRRVAEETAAKEKAAERDAADERAAEAQARLERLATALREAEEKAAGDLAAEKQAAKAQLEAERAAARQAAAEKETAEQRAAEAEARLERMATALREAEERAAAMERAARPEGGKARVAPHPEESRRPEASPSLPELPAARVEVPQGSASGRDQQTAAFSSAPRTPGEIVKSQRLAIASATPPAKKRLRIDLAKNKNPQPLKRAK